MVWCDLGLNPGLLDHWQTLYPLGQWARLEILHNIWAKYYFVPWPVELNCGEFWIKQSLQMKLELISLFFESLPFIDDTFNPLVIKAVIIWQSSLLSHKNLFFGNKFNPMLNHKRNINLNFITVFFLTRLDLIPFKPYNTYTPRGWLKENNNASMGVPLLEKQNWYYSNHLWKIQRIFWMIFQTEWNYVRSY